jgi:hypothetical protein
MADDLTPTDAQHTVELDNGIVLAGMGGDHEALQAQFEDRAEALTGTPVEGTSETQAPSAAPAPPLTEPVEPTPRGRKRYDVLTREREDAIRARDVEKTAREAAEAKARDLEARLVAPPATAPPPVPAPRVTEGIRAKPVEEEIGIKYATHADFIVDLARWVVEGERAELIQTLDARTTSRIEADRASRNRMDLANNAFARGRSAYPDFDARLNAPEVAKILLPPSHQAAILAMPEAEHVMYELASHPETLQRLVSLPPSVELGMELARLVPRTAVASPASTASVVRSTLVPAPPQPVGSGTRTTNPSAADIAMKGGDDYDSSGYREKRRTELRR